MDGRRQKPSPSIPLTAFAVMKGLVLLLPLGSGLVVASPVHEKRQALSVDIPAVTPNDASAVIDHGYPSFAMSAHSFFEYSNDFSANLIEEVSKRTGAPVHLRVGGTSGDFSTYDPNQAAAIILPPGAAPGQIPRGIVLGPSWYRGFRLFRNVKFTYSAPFAHLSKKANSVAATKLALSEIGPNLDALEIGNEYNFYPGDNRAAGFSPAKLVTQWSDYADAITAAVGPIDASKWQAPVLFNNNCPWCVSRILNLFSGTKYNIGAVSVHHYMPGGIDPPSLQSVYMNHTAITTALNRFKKPIAWLRANRPKTLFIFGENNSHLGSAITRGTNITLGVFGSALWLADYMLYGATIGAKRMHIQQSTGYAYTSWRAVEYYGLPPAVMPPYYAHPFVADIIGKNGDVRIKNFDLGLSEFAAYGVWDNASNALKRIVLLNLNTWRTTDAGGRPSRSVAIRSGSLSGTYTVDKLTAPGADTIDGSQVTWKGTSWSWESKGLPYQQAPTSETVRASNGRIGPVSVRSSEAVVINIA